MTPATGNSGLPRLLIQGDTFAASRELSATGA